MRLLLPISILCFLLGGCSSQRQQPPANPAGADGFPKVLVRIAPSSSGELDGDSVGRSLARQTDRLETCYEEVGEEAAGRGVVYLLFDVEPGAQITRVTIGHSDVRGTHFERCLRQVLREQIVMPDVTERSMLQAHLVFGARDMAEGRQMMRDYRASRAVDAQSEESEDLQLTDLRGRIQSCYERALRNSPGLRGRLVLELTVAEDGQVSEAEVSESLRDGRLDRCVIGAVRNLRIEQRHASAMTLSYPVFLEPGR